MRWGVPRVGRAHPRPPASSEPSRNVVPGPRSLRARGRGRGRASRCFGQETRAGEVQVAVRWLARVAVTGETLT